MWKFNVKICPYVTGPVIYIEKKSAPSEIELLCIYVHNLKFCPVVWIKNQTSIVIYDYITKWLCHNL